MTRLVKLIFVLALVGAALAGMPYAGSGIKAASFVGRKAPVGNRQITHWMSSGDLTANQFAICNRQSAIWNRHPRSLLPAPRSWPKARRAAPYPLHTAFVGRRPVHRGHRHIVEPEVDTELCAMMDHVVHDHGAKHGDSRHLEHFVPTHEQRPGCQ